MAFNPMKKYQSLLLLTMFLCLLPAVPVQAGGLTGKLGKSLGFGAVEEFLPPERAFVFSAEVVDADTIVARWTIADGYYLYRNKFSFRFPDAPEVVVGQPVFPSGKFKDDEYFGRMEVYYHEVAVTLPLRRKAGERRPLVLEVRYQGCADRGFCYPPMKKTIDLVLPGAGNVAAPMTTGLRGGGTPLAEEDRIARSLASGSLWLNLLGFFGFGLLLAFTPCVFPMVPILSGIIVGQGEGVSTRRAFLLSISYVLAMALTYTAAGVGAALFGSNLQIMFQNPWILGAFSALFVVLALSMFGLYQFQLPPALQTRLSGISQRYGRGGWLGASVMGFFSALIVGPCVAAPLAGILLYIGMSGDAWLGGLSLFVLSLGMGLPLVVFGTSAGSLLPRAGPWMDAVKSIFGVLLLGVAIWLLERIVPPAVTLLLWAALLIVIAVYMGAFERLEGAVSGWRRLWKGTGLVMAVYGVVLMVGAASGGRDVFRPLAGTAFVAAPGGGGPEAGPAAFRRVKGLAALEQEIAAAAARGQPVMVDFYADWCIECKRLERSTFGDPAVRRTLAQMVLLQVDVTDNDALDQALLKKFGLFGPPAILFFDGRGREMKGYRLIGFLEADAFRRHARNVLAEVS